MGANHQPKTGNTLRIPQEIDSNKDTGEILPGTGGCVAGVAPNDKAGRDNDKKGDDRKGQCEGGNIRHGIQI